MPAIGSYVDGTLTADFNGSRVITYVNNNNIIGFNTFVGMRGFHLQGTAEFNTSVNSPNNISFTSPFNSDFITMNYWLFKTYYCSYTNPYYDQAILNCFKNCPIRTSNDNATLTCKVCPYDCLTCFNNGTCISCDSANDFRQLENGYCVPIPGYYESHAQAALPCPQKGCSDCTATQCFECISGYYKRGNNCYVIQDDVQNSDSNSGLSVTLMFVGILLGLILAYIFLMLFLKCKKSKESHPQVMKLLK